MFFWYNKTGLQPVSRTCGTTPFGFKHCRRKNQTNFFRGKHNIKLNDCFPGKTSLAKNFKMFFRGWPGVGCWGTHPCYKTYVRKYLCKIQLYSKYPFLNSYVRGHYSHKLWCGILCLEILMMWDLAPVRLTSLCFKSQLRGKHVSVYVLVEVQRKPLWSATHCP